MSLKGIVVTQPRNARPRGHAHLQRVANAPLICHVLVGLHRIGIAQVAIVLDPDEREETQRCVEADCAAPLEVAYIERVSGARAALAAGAFVGGDPCVLHAAAGVMAGASVKGVANAAAEGELTALVHRSAPGAGSIGLAGHRMARLAGIDPDAPAMELADVCVLGPGVFARLAEEERFGLGALDILAAAELLAAAGGPPRLQRIDAWADYDGEASRLLSINHLLLDMAAVEWPEYDPPAGTRMEGPVSLHPTATVRSSTIVGPAIIGPGAFIGDSYIGPYTSIDAGVHIEGAELERSVILPGASITHIGGRLVGSVVGRDTKIFRDFSLPRALRLNVGDGGEVALC